MKRLSQPTVLKSTCNRSSNYLYELLLDSEREAQNIANDIHKIVKLHRQPNVRFSTRMTKRCLGTCCYNGNIKLFPPKGKTVGTLLHELAHLFPSAVADNRPHGFHFKVGLMAVKNAWDQIKNKYMPFDNKAWSPAACEGLKDGFTLKPALVSVPVAVQSIEVKTSAPAPIERKHRLRPEDIELLKRRNPNFKGFTTVVS